MRHYSIRTASLLPLALLLSSCTSMVDRLNQVGERPSLTQIQNPTLVPHYRPVTMPMPQPVRPERLPNSLWQPGARAFFKDQRARQVGDILTVAIKIADNASVKNTTKLERTSDENNIIEGILGTTKNLKTLLPSGADTETAFMKASSKPKHEGKGEIVRNDVVNLRLAATITQVLPNGNLVIQGRQEVRVNNEVRDLEVSGIVRREDIMADNTVAYEKIAEARISYGGRGHMTNIQEKPYGYQFLDAVLPF